MTREQIAQATIETARHEIGVREIGNSNRGRAKFLFAGRASYCFFWCETFCQSLTNRNFVLNTTPAIFHPRAQTFGFAPRRNHIVVSIVAKVVRFGDPSTIVGRIRPIVVNAVDFLVFGKAIVQGPFPKRSIGFPFVANKNTPPAVVQKRFVFRIAAPALKASKTVIKVLCGMPVRRVSRNGFLAQCAPAINRCSTLQRVVTNKALGPTHATTRKINFRILLALNALRRTNDNPIAKGRAYCYGFPKRIDIVHYFPNYGAQQ